MANVGEERIETRWIRADLHLHTPASEDYAEPEITFLEILHEAERRELEIIAFTDHNTVHGYERFRKEVDFLEALELAERLTADEQAQLQEYRRILSKITVLPGFEFTSHYGAHILGIFAPSVPVSVIEATLLQLGVPPDMLKSGTCSIPNTHHVTDAYRIIAEQGGVVIAAHANGPNGVITETLRMGTSGQARIAATQSPFLNALEFVNYYTDHEKFTSPSFYNGRTEHYDRRMFCIQGSDAHRLRRLPHSDLASNNGHGIGDRYIEFLLPDNSFEALRDLLQSHDFDRVRVPKRDQKQWDVDALRFGATSERQILRSFAEDAAESQELWQDVAALANMGGGVLVIGCAPGGQVSGVARPEVLSESLRQQVQEHLDQQPYISLELMKYEGRDVMRVEVKADKLPPYLSHGGVVYVRRDNETVPAHRGELMQLCRRALAEDGELTTTSDDDLDLPRSGVEIVSEQQRSGLWYYEVRDLRTTASVTRDKAQGLWAYAISRHEDLRERRLDLYSQVRWRGRLGIWRAYRQGNRIKYDLVHRDENGLVDRIFYGVSDWGLGEDWASLLNERRDDTVEAEPQDYELGNNGLFIGEEDSQTLPELVGVSWGEHRYRWRGRGGLWQIYLDEHTVVRFDLAMKDKDGVGIQEFFGVPPHKLTEAWLSLIRVPRPRTGIEVVSAELGDDGEWRYVFRDLRTGDSSGAPWRLQDIKAGTVREYAARMYLQDIPLDESRVRWWGNIGYMRPMRSQVDLVYRDEHGVDHLFYAARREELQYEWRDLLVLYGEM
ncbi:MAG: AAA family ATPase [Chloroflexaceae bacterium]|nr:AAA family ATPase [Chloroflexaceae bacterium]